MRDGSRSKLPWILVLVLSCLWAAGLYRTHLLQQTIDSLSAALDSTRTQHADSDAKQAAFLIDALMRLRADDSDGASGSLEQALEPLVRQLETASPTETTDAALQLVRLYGESRSSQVPDNPGLATLTGAKILPVYEEGRLIGLRLRSIEAGSAFESAGLTEDDRITAVGELELQSNRDAVSGMRMMRAGQVMKLRVVDASGHERTVGWPPF